MGDVNLLTKMSSTLGEGKMKYIENDASLLDPTGIRLNYDN